MNKLEWEYSERLNVLYAAREIQGYMFEPLTLALAQRTSYTPDFMVVRAGAVEFHEVKGFMRDDAAVKLKVAAAKFPTIPFYLCRKVKGSWKIEEVPNKDKEGKNAQ